MDITSSNVKGTKFRWSTFFLIICVIVLLLLVVGVSFIQFKRYPKYITTFRDKYRYTLSLPNDELINKLYEQTFPGQGLGKRVITLFNSENGQYYGLFYDDYGYYSKRKEADVNKSYIVLDTIHSISEINRDSLYIIFDRGDYHLHGGEEAIELYEKYQGRYNSIMLCSKYNLNNKIKVDSEISDVLLSIPASNRETSYKACFFVSGKPNVVCNYLELCLKRQKKNLDILEYYLILITYLNNDNDKIELIANKVLSLKPNHADAYCALALASVNRQNWMDAIKYSKLSLDYDTSDYSGDNHLILAWALYHTGEKEKAQEEYNLGYNWGSSPLAEKYKECAGCPFVINDIEISFIDENGRIITDYGKKLYSKNSKYISPRLKIRALRRFENESVFYKLFEPNGELSRSNSSPVGYTVETDDIYCSFYGTKTYDTTIGLKGWGSSVLGNWEPGLYSLEIWYGGKMIGRTSFRIY